MFVISFVQFLSNECKGKTSGNLYNMARHERPTQRSSLVVWFMRHQTHHAAICKYVYRYVTYRVIHTTDWIEILNRLHRQLTPIYIIHLLQSYDVNKKMWLDDISTHILAQLHRIWGFLFVLISEARVHLIFCL